MTENEFLLRLHQIRDGLGSDEDRSKFDRGYFSEMKNPVVQYGYNYYLGWLAIGRFTLGHTGVAIVKLLVGIIGTLGSIVSAIGAEEPELAIVGTLISLPITVWVIVDYFLMPGATRRVNIKKAEQLAATIS